MGEGQSVEILLTGNLVGALLQFAKALGDVEDQIDERTVGGAFDLEFAEENVGLEVVERLVDDVLLVGFWKKKWVKI